MPKKRYCRYCGCKITNVSGICNACGEKLILIRKIRKIVFAIQRDAMKKRGMTQENGQTGHYPDAQTVQRIAS